MFKIRKSDEKFYFVLTAKNNEVIVTSEMYESLQACKKGIASVKKNAVKAKVEVEKETPISEN